VRIDDVGRAVRDFLAAAATEPAALVVEGEAGIGKTTQLGRIVEQAGQAGFRVLSAGAASAEARLTFTVIAELLDGVESSSLERLPPVQRIAVDRILQRGDAGPPTDERVAAAAFRSVLEVLAEAMPVLVAVDDAQCIDVSSRTVLSYATRRLRGRVGVAVTARTDDKEHPAPVSWLEVLRDDAVRRLTLGPMPLAAMQAMLNERPGRRLRRPTMARIHQISGGNPFYALELARAIDDQRPGAHLELSDSLDALVERRLKGLDEAAAALLLAAAAASAPTVDLLAEAAGLSTARVTELLENAERHGVVTLDGPRVHFTHPLLAHGVYTRAGAERRRTAHRRLAEVSGLPEVRARHLALAAVGADEETLAALDAAADAVGARGAFGAAAELLDLATGLGDDNPVRRLRAADYHFRAGALDEADSRLAGLVDTLRPGTLRAVALMLRGAVYGYHDRFDRAAEVLAQGLAEAGDNPDLRVRGRMLLALAIGMADDLAGSFEHACAAVEDADRAGTPALRSQALALYVHVRLMYGLGTDRDALRIALELEDPFDGGPATVQASAVYAVNRAWEGDLSAARVAMAAAARRCTERGNEVDVVWAGEFATMIELWSGRLPDAQRLADDALQRARSIGGQLPLISALAARAAVAAYAGRPEETYAYADEALAAARDSGIAYMAAAPTASLALLEVSRGDHRAALSRLAPLLAAFDPLHDTEIMRGGHLPDAIEALTALGRADEAEPLVAALEVNGARLDRPWMQAVAARGRAQLAVARGDLAGAEQHAERAVAVHDSLPMPFERARTLLTLGAVQRRRRRRQAADTALHGALTIFADIGCALWADRARAEMALLHSTGAEGQQLTATEQQVAERAADGLSNREIAAEVFLSEKMVELHLSRVYRKLGIRSRSQLFLHLRQVDGDS
jgi:DNA-binding CsgD family transcriptional regulator